MRARMLAPVLALSVTASELKDCGDSLFVRCSEQYKRDATACGKPASKGCIADAERDLNACVREAATTLKGE